MFLRRVSAAPIFILLSVSVLMAQTQGSGEFRIVGGNIPVYPSIARLAGVSGTVRLNVEVHNGEVAQVSFISASSKGAEKWLVANARKCAESWTFPGNTNGSISAEFVYTSTLPGTADSVNVRFVSGRTIKVSLQSARPKPYEIRDPAPLKQQP